MLQRLRCNQYVQKNKNEKQSGTISKGNNANIHNIYRKKYFIQTSINV